MYGGDFLLFRRYMYICTLFFPPITGGGGGWIKVRLISNPGLLLFLVFLFRSFSLPAAARLLFHFFSAAALFMRKRDEGETSKMKMAAVCLRVPTTPCQLGIVIPSAACLSWLDTPQQTRRPPTPTRTHWAWGACDEKEKGPEWRSCARTTAQEARSSSGFGWFYCPWILV